MLSLDFRTWQDSSLNLATNDNSRGQPLQLVLDSEINSNAILLTNIMAYFRGGYGKGGCSQKCAENMRGLKFGRLRPTQVLPNARGLPADEVEFSRGLDCHTLNYPRK